MRQVGAHVSRQTRQPLRVSPFGDSGVVVPFFGSRAQQDVQTAVAKSQSPPRGPMTSSWTVAQTTPLSLLSRT